MRTLTLGKINIWRSHVGQALACCLSDRRPVSLLTRRNHHV